MRVGLGVRLRKDVDTVKVLSIGGNLATITPGPEVALGPTSGTGRGRWARRHDHTSGAPHRRPAASGHLSSSAVRASCASAAAGRAAAVDRGAGMIGPAGCIINIVTCRSVFLPLLFTAMHAPLFVLAAGGSALLRAPPPPSHPAAAPALVAAAPAPVITPAVARRAAGDEGPGPGIAPIDTSWFLPRCNSNCMFAAQASSYCDNGSGSAADQDQCHWLCTVGATRERGRRGSGREVAVGCQRLELPVVVGTHKAGACGLIDDLLSPRPVDPSARRILAACRRAGRRWRLPDMSARAEHQQRRS